MQILKLLIFFAILIICSCKKENINPNVTGKWKWLHYQGDSPINYQTPQNTGIQETLSFTNSSYNMTQNGVITNSGTYKTSTAMNTYGKRVLSILYSNSRVTDSVTYFSFASNHDSLFFSYDLIGSVGGGVSCYVKE